jgi:hypothetical protein
MRPTITLISLYRRSVSNMKKGSFYRGGSQNNKSKLSGKPLPYRVKLQLSKQATYMQYRDTLDKMSPFPKNVENKSNVFNIQDARKKAAPTSCGMPVVDKVMYSYKEGGVVPCYKLCQELEAWFRAVEPIPNGVCWLDDKEGHINRTKNSQKSRGLSYELSTEEAPVWEKPLPLSHAEALRSAKNNKPIELDGETIQFLVDRVGTTTKYDALSNPVRFGAATKNTRLPIMPRAARAFSKASIEFAILIRNIRTERELEFTVRPWYKTFLLITEGFIRSKIRKYQNKLPLGYAPKDRDTPWPKQDIVTELKQNMLTYVPRRSEKCNYNWYVHTRRCKSVLKRALMKSTGGWKKYLKKERFITNFPKHLGTPRKPIYFDLDAKHLSEKREINRYYKWWWTKVHVRPFPQHVSYWPEQEEAAYQWWLRCMIMQDLVRAEELIATRSVVNPVWGLALKMFEKVKNIFTKHNKREEYVTANCQNILAPPIKDIEQEEELPLEDLIDKLEDHCYEDHLSNTMKRTQEILDEFMLNLAKAEQTTKTTGEIEYIAFKRALPMIAEQMKQQFPLPEFEDNEQPFAEEVSMKKASGSPLRYC